MKKITDTTKQALLIKQNNAKEAENALNYYHKHKDDDDLKNLAPE